jgi:hypothetical protein
MVRNLVIHKSYLITFLKILNANILHEGYHSFRCGRGNIQNT